MIACLLNWTCNFLIGIGFPAVNVSPLSNNCSLLYNTLIHMTIPFPYRKPPDLTCSWYSWLCASRSQYSFRSLCQKLRGKPSKKSTISLPRGKLYINFLTNSFRIGCAQCICFPCCSEMEFERAAQTMTSRWEFPWKISATRPVTECSRSR